MAGGQQAIVPTSIQIPQHLHDAHSPLPKTPSSVGDASLREIQAGDLQQATDTLRRAQIQRQAQQQAATRHMTTLRR